MTASPDLWALAQQNIAAHGPLDPLTVAAVAPLVMGLADDIPRRMPEAA